MSDSKPSLDPFFKFKLGEFVRSAGDPQEPVSIEHKLLGVSTEPVVRFQVTDRRIIEYPGGLEVGYDVRIYQDGIPMVRTVQMTEPELAEERTS